MIIFDSRKASAVYEGQDFARSESFTVPACGCAKLELTTHDKYFNKISFDVLRVIEGEEVFVKPYRTKTKEGVRVVGLGVTGGEVTEHIVITRPGRYYLTTQMNKMIQDTDSPSIVELSICE